MKTIQSCGIAIGLVLCAAGQVHASNIVVNGGFETGDFSAWTHSTTSSDAWEIDSIGFGDANHGPNSGAFYAATGCTGASCIGSDTSAATAYLYQDLTTIAGDNYGISFFFASGGEPGQELLVTFGGATVEDLLNLPGNNSSPYSFYSMSIIASGTTTRLEFQGRQDISFSGLDDISVTDLTTAAAPEPGSLLLVVAGLAALGLSRGRRA